MKLVERISVSTHAYTVSNKDHYMSLPCGGNFKSYTHHVLFSKAAITQVTCYHL